MRQGVGNRFAVGELLRDGRHVAVTDRRTMREWAHCIQEVVEVHSPAAERLVLVLDTRNIHVPAALYVTFPPAQARRLVEQLERHDTPKHGSWLNRAEIELSALSRQCLDRRFPSRAAFEQEVAAWQTARNAAQVTVDWRFTPAHARIKLEHLSPSLQL